MKQIIQRRGQAHWPGNSQEKKSGRCCRGEKKRALRLAQWFSLSSHWLSGYIFAVIHIFLWLHQQQLWWFLHPKPLGSTSREATLPSRKSTPKVNAKIAVLKRDWFRRTGAEEDPSNKSTSSCQSRIKVCEQQLAEQHKCSSCFRCWYACYCLVCGEQEPVKDVVSFSLNNADRDGAVLQASC